MRMCMDCRSAPTNGDSLFCSSCKCMGHRFGITSPESMALRELLKRSFEGCPTAPTKEQVIAGINNA